MPDLTTDFAQVESDIRTTEGLTAQALALAGTMTADGGSFQNFKNDFDNLVTLLNEINASLGTPAAPPAPAPPAPSVE